LVEIIISRLIKETKKIFPPVVIGIVVMLIGLGVKETGMTNFGGGQGQRILAVSRIYYWEALYL